MRTAKRIHWLVGGLLLGSFTICQASSSPPSQTVSFQSGGKTLQGLLYKPSGNGPFPAILFNHGSAPGMASREAFDALGPRFQKQGWVFFGPFRRGQGLSASAGPYIGDQIEESKKRGGMTAAAGTMVRLLQGDHLDDQFAARAWLQAQPFVQGNRIAVAGNSFGGVESVLGAARGGYCASIDSAGGAQSWALAPQLQTLMLKSVRNSKVPIFFFQAANDYDLSPSRVLSAAMTKAGKTAVVKIYPAFGSSADDGHALGYFGASVWMRDVMQFLEQHCAGSSDPTTSPVPSVKAVGRGNGRVAEQ